MIIETHPQGRGTPIARAEKPRRIPAAGAPGVLVLLTGLVLGTAACSPLDDGTSDGSPRIVASIFPIGDLARSVAGPDVQVRVLLPAGASPATFDPTPATLRAIRDARVFLLVGGGLDTWAAALAPTDDDARRVVLTGGLELRGEAEHEGTGNPHVWLDPVLTRDHLLPRITSAVISADPANEERIRRRAAALADTLTALDREIRSALAELPSRDLVTTHAAWHYYAERYDLTLLGVVHRHPGQEPLSRTLAAVLDAARRAGVPAVFGEPQVPDAAGRALAAELGVPFLVLDPLGDPGAAGRDSYPALMRYNTRRIVRGLSGAGSR